MNDELERQIRDEAEATRDAPLSASDGDRLNRTRSAVYPVRLTPAEAAAVQEAANRLDLPASTVIRSWIAERADGPDHSIR
jgi:hypothetical protein